MTNTIKYFSYIMIFLTFVSKSFNIKLRLPGELILLNQNE